MLSDRITTLFHLLGCNNSDIARVIDCTPSNISRIHLGRRAYKPQDRPILRFADGVYTYADENNMLASLRTLCRAESDGRDVLIPALIAWLFETDEESLPQIVVPPSRIKRVRQEQKRRGFGERLSEVMELLEMSTVRLARQVNVDASHISRFRNGVRSPRLNSALSKRLAEALLRRAAEQDRVPALSKTTGIPVDVLTDEEEGLTAFSAWLRDIHEEPDTSDIDRLLDCIDSFSPETKTPLPELPSIPADGITGPAEYWGIDGLREAVARFLGNTARQGGELWLYSDEDMDWMVSDPAFFAKWYALMLACVKRGTKVKIIHHLDRGTEEMISAIQSWMPLYMSGMIESYVCRRGRDVRFSRTVFLRPGAECVRAGHVKGAEPQGWYEYLTDGRKLSVLAAEFEMLLNRCEPLVKIHLEPDGSLFPPSGGSLSCMLSGLSLGTMPEGLVDALLERSGVTGDEARRITDFCRVQRNILKTALANGGVCEFTPLPKDDELFAGTVRVNLSPSLCERDLYYTPDEYAVHVKAISELLESNTAYRFYALPEPPFPDIQIIRSGGSVTVVRSRKPYAAFVFTEPVMLRAFESYFDVMGGKYKCPRSETRQMLRRFM